MYLLFEEYVYKTKDVKDILGPFILSGLDLTKDTLQLNYVGYFYNNEKNDIVFILPKVLLEEGENKEERVFGLTPEIIIKFDSKAWKGDESLVVEDSVLSKNAVFNFIYGFTIWIYRAVSVYRSQQRQKKGDIDDDLKAEVMSSANVGVGHKKEFVTYMDILLSLLNYEKEHRSFISYAMKMAHSGNNRISWTKTISKTTAYLQDDIPLYVNPINKKKEINFDEELFVIYYSILNYLHDEYGFPISKQPGYKLITGHKFDDYIRLKGKVRLRQIRYKYFSDNAVLLWNLCYAFFTRAEEFKSQINMKDYLLVNSFNCVFEAMIDELVGDKNLPEGLKVHGDDKRIDHLYTYKYLLEKIEDTPSSHEKDIYHIADSKYYRRDKTLRGHDVPKQFTYARNVIQWHMDLLNDLLYCEYKDDSRKKKLDIAQEYKEIKLFDKITEGYNIIPNFFISAKVNEKLNYDSSDFSPTTLKDGKHLTESYQFWDRLFDRDSLFTLHYDVNFLYILKLYAQNKNYSKSEWKSLVREEFRKGILEYLKSHFLFYQIIIRENDIENFVEKHYRKIVGKVFTFEDKLGQKVLLYAERQDQDKGNGKSFTYSENYDSHIKDGMLVIPSKTKNDLYKITNVNLGHDAYQDVNGRIKQYALVGYYKDQAHLDWIIKNGIYNIPSKQRGKNKTLNEAEIFATKLILHNNERDCHVFNVTSDTICCMTKEQLPQGGYVPSHNEYYIYGIDVATEDNSLLSLLIESSLFQKKLQQKKPIAVRLDILHCIEKEVPITQIKYKFDEEDFFMTLVAEE